MADKTYRISISTPATAGSAVLEAGEYKLTLQNEKVQFTHVSTGTQVESSAKVDETAEKKFADTLVLSKQIEDRRVITQICLGGTKTKLAFE